MSPRKDRAFWERTIRELKESKLTHEEFARQRELNVGTLRGWLYRGTRKKARAVRMLPVRVSAAASAGSTFELIEIGVAGSVVRIPIGADLQYIVELVTRLRDRC